MGRGMGGSPPKRAWDGDGGGLDAGGRCVGEIQLARVGIWGAPRAQEVGGVGREHFRMGIRGQPDSMGGTQTP